jgi:hypothetical protein
MAEAFRPLSLESTKSATKKGRGLKALPPWLKPGNPGHKVPKRGPLDKIVEICRTHTKEDAIPILVGVMRNEGADAKDRIKACEVIGKWAGMDNSPTVTVNDNRAQPAAMIVYLPQLGAEMHKLPEIEDDRPATS